MIDSQRSHKINKSIRDEVFILIPFLPLFFRETIMRLISEVGQEKKCSSQSQETVNSLTRERDTLQQKIREMEIEVDRMKHQLAASQDAWGVTKKQLDERENK